MSVFATRLEGMLALLAPPLIHTAHLASSASDFIYPVPGHGEMGVAGREESHLHSGKYDPLLHVNVVMSAAVKRVMGRLAGGRGCWLIVAQDLPLSPAPSLLPLQLFPARWRPLACWPEL